MGLLQQVTINTVYRITFLVFQLLNTILISRLIGPEGFGVYSLVIINANLLLVFSSLGIPAGILFHASARDLPLNRIEKILWVSTLLQFVLAAVVEFIHHSFKGSYWIWPSDEMIYGAMGILFFLAIVVTEKYYALYNGFHKFPLYNLITVIFNTMLFLVLALMWTDNAPGDAATIIQVYIAVQLIQVICLILVFHLGKLGKHPIIESAGVQRKFINYSLYAFLANALFFLVTRVDFWILEYYKGATELGWYALSSRIGQMFLVLPGLFAGIVLPSLTAGKIGADKLESMLRILNTMNIIIMTSLAIIMPWLMPFLFGNKFESSVLPLLMLLPGIFFLAAQTLLASYFAAKGTPSINFYSTIIALSIVLVLDFILIPVHGAPGAAAASTVAYAAGTLYTYLLYIKQEKYQWSKLLMKRQDLQHFLNMIRKRS
jgi:O-antigen/teichoic acid export membrane protein